MPIDPANPVAILCARGMEAEAAGDFDEAHRCFLAAWEAATSPYESAMAAHFVARNQPTVAEGLHWNRTALEKAQEAPADQVREFLPSLYLNLANSCFLFEDFSAARRYVDLGEGELGSLPPGPYANVVRDGLSRLRGKVDEMG